MPVYLVSPGDRLIRANTFSQAINYAAKASMQATPLRADDVLDRIQKGAKIEDARKPETAELFPAPAPEPAAGNGVSAPQPQPPGEPDPYLKGPKVFTPPPDHFGDRVSAGDLRPPTQTVTQPADIDTVEIDHVR